MTAPTRETHATGGAVFCRGSHARAMGVQAIALLGQPILQAAERWNPGSPKVAMTRPTLLGKSPKPISNAIEVSFSREMAPVSPAFERRMQDRFPAGFRLNQQSPDLLYVGGELPRLTSAPPQAVARHGP
jgi:hypothetical protein